MLIIFLPNALKGNTYSIHRVIGVTLCFTGEVAHLSNVVFSVRHIFDPLSPVPRELHLLSSMIATDAGMAEESMVIHNTPTHPHPRCHIFSNAAERMADIGTCAKALRRCFLDALQCFASS